MQLLVTLLAVGLALGYLARASYREWFGPNGGCGSGCGTCPAAAPTGPPPAGRVGLPMAGD